MVNHGAIQQVAVGIDQNAAKAHGENVHHQHAGKVEQIKPKGAPEILDGFSQGPVAQVADGYQQEIGRAGEGCEHITEQPPDLTLEDQIPVKAQNVLEHKVLGKHAHQIYHCIAQNDIQHQIGDALVSVAEAKNIKTLS